MINNFGTNRERERERVTNPRRFFSLFLIIILAVFFYVGLSFLGHENRVGASTITYYISPSGLDSNPCSLSQPCLTIPHVQSVVQAVIAGGMTSNVDVYLREGTYQLSTGLSLGTSDSGSNGYSITWASYPGENAVISGGQEVTEWSLYSGSIYRAYVGTSWNFRQLYINGVHAQRASGASNPTGWTQTSTGYTAPDSSMASWGNPTNIEIVSLSHWAMARCKVASISDTAITMQNPCWTNEKASNSHFRSTPSWVENAYELMASGYWYLDRTTGYLYYWPPSGNMTGVTVTAPVVDHILTITDASNINFSKLTFSYSNWTGIDSGTGYVGNQSGYAFLTPYPYSPPIISTPSNSIPLDSAISVSGSNNVKFMQGEFSHLGSRALFVQGGSSNVWISGNSFDDNAAGLLQLGSVYTCPATQESSILVNNNNISTGNEFDYLDNGAIFAPCITSSTISNNNIMGTPWVPIAIGWNGWWIGWGRDSTAYSTQNTISNNNIQNYCTGFLDCGGIYTNGSQSSNGTYLTGLSVTGNYITGNVHGHASFYPDEGSNWETWTGNVSGDNIRWLLAWTSSIHDLTLTGNYLNSTTYENNGINVTISPNTLGITGEAAQAIISSSGTIPGALSTADQISSFNFTSPVVIGTINNSNHTVSLTVPYGTSVTSLAPTIVVSAGATISPTSGTTENFTNPVAYTVTAQDGVTQATYTVTVTISSLIPIISGWSYRKQIAISNVNVGSTLSYFPLLVRISNDSDIGAGVSDTTHGYDIRFADSNGNLLPYEREDFSVTGGVASGNFWVQVPSISSSTITPLYIYYGNSSASSTDWTVATSTINNSGSGGVNCTLSSMTNAQCVWNENGTQNYAGVYHLKETGTGSVSDYIDSTKNSNNGGQASAEPTQTSSGQIGGAQSFNGSSQYINIPNSNGFNFSGSNTVTLSAWFKYNGVDGVLLTKGFECSTYPQWRLSVVGGQLSITFSNANTYSGPHTALSTTLTSGQWYYAVALLNGNTFTVSLNGNINAFSKAFSGTLWNDTTDFVDFGAISSTGSCGTPKISYFNGIIDEARVASVARSASWIKFESCNEMSTSDTLKCAPLIPGVPSSYLPNELGFSPQETSSSYDATLNATTTTVKGATLTGAGTPNSAIGSATDGTVTLTAVQAADTSNSGSYITTFLATDAGATVNKFVKYTSGNATYTTSFATDAAYTTTAVTNGDFFIVKITAADGMTVLYYKVVVTVTANTATLITSFVFTSPSVTGTINNTNHTVSLTVPYSTVVTSLTPTIAVSAGATISPTSGTAENFTDSQTYTVTAQDGITQQAYTVTVTVSPNTAKAITSFGFNALTPAVTGTINGTAIALTVPYGTPIIALVATFSTTGSLVTVGGVTQTSGTTANNFISPVTYTVTAADNSTQTYTVTVTVVANSAPTNLSYTSPNVYTRNGAITPLSPTITGSGLTYSVSPSLPTGLSLDTSTGIISGTPTAVTSLATYIVTVTNSGGDTTFGVVITINNSAPTNLSYTSPNVYTRNGAITPLSPTITGSGLTYGVSPSLPTGLSLDTSTGIISGTPTATSTQTTYTVTATNSGGNTTFGVVITVNNTDSTAPVISSISSNGNTVTFSTNEPSSTLVEYGLTTSYGTSTTETDISPLVTSHTILISNISSCVTYHYRIHSKDASLNEVISSDNTLTTNGCTASSISTDQGTVQIDRTQGGTLSLSGIQIDIPIDFSSQSANFQAHELDKTTVISTTSVPSGYVVTGANLYELKALSDNTTVISSFDNSLTITMPYTSDDIQNISESSLKIYRWDNSSWNELQNCEVNTSLKEVTCNTNNFSVFGIFGKQNTTRSTSSGCSVQCRVSNLIAMGNTTAAESLKKQWPNLYPTETITLSSSIFKFTKTLKQGMTNSQVKELQKYLNSKGYIVSKQGAGSPSQETNYFGSLTKKAVIKFQLANGLKGDGVFGKKSMGEVR